MYNINMNQMRLENLHCKRCGYNWYPRKVNGKTHDPKNCAKCNSPYWNLPIVRKSVSEARKK